LFAIRAPWDAAPTEFEKQDARDSAADMQLPAIVFLLVVGFVVTLAGPSRFQTPLSSGRRQRLLVLAFIVSVLADLGTTLWFFHDGGIDLELHPGIRLFGYAYGRTAGPIAGKLVQAAGILIVARWLGRGGSSLVAAVTLLYAAAAIYNVLQMPIFAD